MRRLPFRLWSGSILCCRYHRAAQSVTASNITGTEPLSLYAALDVHTGEVHGKTARRHTSVDFVTFLGEVVERTPPGKDVHIVLDNLSAHKTQAVRDFLEQNPRVGFHFTPTYSSWLNQVELWLAKIQRDVITRGVFTSVADLSRKLMKYIRAYAKSAPLPLDLTPTPPGVSK